MLKLFLSWSGSTSHKIADILGESLYSLFRESIEFFYSPENIRSGDKWLYELNEALKNSKFGILCITKDNLNSAWINFEAGAIGKSLVESKVCPVLINVDRNSMQNHPLNIYQSVILSDKEDMRKLLHSICNELETRDKIAIVNILRKEFDTKWWPHFNGEIQAVLKEESETKNQTPKSIMTILAKHNIDPSTASQQYGILTPIPENLFHEIRREIIGLTSNSLVLVGSSLNEAFDSSNPTTDITNVIEERIKECEKEFSLQIFLSEPKLFDENYKPGRVEISSKSPIGRLGRTLEELKDIALKAGSKLNLSIYFIPLLQLDHIVMVNDIMIVRNTMLWDSKGEYKGSWILCRRVEDKNSMFKAYERYINAIKENSVQVVHDNFHKIDDHDTSSILTAADKFAELWRNDFFKIDKGRNKIRLHKLYREQLISVLHSSWESRHRNYSPDIHVSNSSEIFKPGTAIHMREDLFKYNCMLGDNTQKTLLPYIQTTETLLNELIRRYDKEGFAQVYPSFDLGIPNNVQRLAGGFATGMFVLWRCGTPIIPVDTTVNICSSSIYEISDVNPSMFSIENINKALVTAHKEGVLGNFSSGNHFLSLCKNRKDKFHLVLHSSAKEFKYSALGLYPHKSSWFRKSLRIYKSKDGSRYLRYIKGEEAQHFINIARSLPEYNESIHEWFSSSIAKSIGAANPIKVSINHHYYMPTTYSVALGTFVEKPGTIVPIFSRPGKPICLFKTSRKQPWSINLAGEDRILIPHGWGHAIRGDLNIRLQKNELLINSVPHHIEEKSSVKNNELDIEIRDFEVDHESDNSFTKQLNRFVGGEVTDVLYQLATYSNGKIFNYYEK